MTAFLFVPANKPDRFIKACQSGASAIIKHYNLPISALIIPKAKNSENLANIYYQIQIPLIALIETAQGLVNIQSIASTNGIKALSFGLLDLANELGITVNTNGAKTILDKIRYELVLASSANGLNKPIETIYKEFKDTDGFLDNARYTYEMGFGGQLCIHPTQVNLAHISYQANDSQKALANEILNKFNKTGEYAFPVQGMMVDLPLIEWARKLQE